MEQVAAECRVGLVAYTITHHTRQSAVGLPKIVTRNYGGMEIDITEYTMSEIIASVYEYMEQTGKKEGILFIDEINCVSETLAPAMLQFLQNKTFGTHKVPQGCLLYTSRHQPFCRSDCRCSCTSVRMGGDTWESTLFYRFEREKLYYTRGGA